MHAVGAEDLGLAVLRLGVAIVMLLHGINHVFGGGKIRGTARWFASLGMRPPLAHAWLASVTEIGSGALLLLGALTPLAAGGVIGTMVVAWISNHRRNGFFIFRPGEGYEYVMILTLAGIALAACGAGRLSIDHLVHAFDPPQWRGLAIGGGAGLGGALLLLLLCWRPGKPATELTK